MSANLRLPNITDGTPQEQMKQMRSYLHQLVEQLQWALDNIDTQKTAVVSAVVQRGASKPSGSSAIEAEATFNAIKSLIIKSAEIVDAYYEEINEKLKGEYFALSDNFGVFKQQTEQTISKNSDDITQAFTNIQTIETDASSKLHETKNQILNNIDGVSTAVGSLESNLQGFKENTEKNIGEVTANVEGLGTKLDEKELEIYSAIDGVKGDVDYIKTSIVEVTANIRSGLLDYNGAMPIYGIEVGQKNIVDGEEVFNKYARFTADRLSFYDSNKVEVAYISDNKLYITNVALTGTLKLGGYLVDTTNGLTLKWVGR